MAERKLRKAKLGMWSVGGKIDSAYYAGVRYGQFDPPHGSNGALINSRRKGQPDSDIIGRTTYEKALWSQRRYPFCRWLILSLHGAIVVEGRKTCRSDGVTNTSEFGTAVSTIP